MRSAPRSAMIREWLAGLISGGAAPWPVGLAYDRQTVLTALQTEGIAALAYQRLSGSKLACPQELHDALQSAARESAMHSLKLDAETRRVLTVLAHAGLPCLLLKGTALAFWLYESPALRERADIDLLVRSKEDADLILKLLASIGYQTLEPFLPGDMVCFERTCVSQHSASLGLELDVHWRLSSTPVFAYRFEFEELWTEQQPLPHVAGNAFGLGPVHAHLHACMHRVQNMAEGSQDRLKWLYDLHLLGQRLSSSQWSNLVQTAKDRGLAGACLDGLAASAQTFRNSTPASVVAALTECSRRESMNVHKMHRWAYIQRMSFMAFPSTRMRLRWLRQRLLPDWRYMTDYYGTSSVLGLLSQRLIGGLKRTLRRP